MIKEWWAPPCVRLLSGIYWIKISAPRVEYLEQPWLKVMLLIFLILSLPLALDVAPNLLLIAVLAHRAREVPVRPKFPSPQHLPHLRALSEYFPRRQAHDHRHQPCHAVRKYWLHQKMHVIPVRTNLYFAGNTKWYSNTVTLWSLWRYLLVICPEYRPKGRGIYPNRFKRRKNCHYK